MNVRLIAFDLDGTLLDDDKHLSYYHTCEKNTS